MGPALLLKVMSGDSIAVGVKSFYRSNGSPGSNNNSLPDVVNSLAQGLLSIAGPGHGTVTSLSASGSPVYAALNSFLPAKETATAGKPKAYLNWMMLDNQFNYVSGQSGALPVGGSDVLNTLAQGIGIHHSGYLYIWVSNETQSWDVFFDNLSVNHYSGPMVEENHYYPFGLTMAGISDKALKGNYAENKYRFNKGSELQNKEFSDGSGLEIYETAFRSYDPQIGRFLQLDALSDASRSQSPFVFGSNNPFLRNDPTGLKDTIINGQSVQRDKDLAPATVKAHAHKHLPAFNNTPSASPPYAEMTTIALDRNMEEYEKIYHLTRITSGTVPYVSRHLDGVLLKNILSGALLHSLDKLFTVIDIYSMAMMSVNGNKSMLEIPMIGGVSQLIVGDAVANSDEVSLTVAGSQGYIPMARMLNSSVGRRSGLVGVYVTEETLKAILVNGGIDSRIKGIVNPGGNYPDNPQNQNGNLNFFVVYPGGSKGTITNFGVMPIH
jgi:RHS repeat-associated protein